MATFKICFRRQSTMNKLTERNPLLNKRVVALFLLLVPFTADVVSATNRPGSSFSANVISGVETAAPLQFTPEDIALCCTGNGDYGFMRRDLAIGALAEDTEETGFLAIPGNSLWSCRRECRDPANNYTDIEACNEVCDCRQGCVTSNDTLTAECRSFCNFPDPIEQDLCYEQCHLECGERCRSTFNGYVIPEELYGSALEILDCIYGDLIGEPEASCRNTSIYWEARGFGCNYTAGVEFDCVCLDPGNCQNTEYPCKYDFHCVSEAPSLVPSAFPSDVPSYIPSDVPSDNPSSIPSSVPSDVPSDNPSSNPSSVPSSVPSDVPSEEPSSNPSSMPSASPSAAPSAYPTPQPTPKPTKGKGKSSHSEDYDDDHYYDDDEHIPTDFNNNIGDHWHHHFMPDGSILYHNHGRRRRLNRRRSRRARTRDRRIVN